MHDLPPELQRRVHAVVLAGGAGTRFWPLSRQARPKQVLDLTGAGTLLAQTFARVTDLAPPARQWMVVGAAHAAACVAAAPAVPKENVLREPRARNTAPAIALAALHVCARDPEAILIVLPADHHVADPAALRRGLATAVRLAAQGLIVTLGIAPSRPETGFGYIERGTPEPRVPGAYAVARFVEKPDRVTAEAYLAAGTYAWNAGIFVMTGKVLRRELERQLPALVQALAPVEEVVGKPAHEAAVAEAYERLEGQSFDYGIMEHAEAAGVVPVDCGWSDVGSLAAIAEVRAADAAGNVLVGKALAVDARGVIVHAGEKERAVVVLGLDDVVVVQTADATLVLPKSRAQDVRRVVDALREHGWSELL